MRNDRNGDLSKTLQTNNTDRSQELVLQDCASTRIHREINNFSGYVFVPTQAVSGVLLLTMKVTKALSLAT